MPIIGVIMAAAMLAASTAPAAAQGWPTRPVTMVVPYAAGGPVDTIGRIVGAGLGRTLGQQVIIDAADLLLSPT
jgi:tripartite-type tricarboxylate transporter receptor subunit TctC